jgi:endonuclease/exonuclease/phosphatase family metal-dependent hydrolase
MTSPAAVVHHSSAPGPEVGTPTELRVLTWNIELATHTLRATRAIEQHTADEDADIVLLQEMDERGTAEIADHLNLNYAYVALSVHPKSDRNFGNAILSPWPLSGVEVVPLPHTAAIQGQPRAALGATVEVGNAPVRAFSVHTETPVLSHRRRLRQFVTIGEAVDQWTTSPVVVGGDFNTASRRSIRAVTRELGGRELHRVSAGLGPTFRRGGRAFSLDHIFARGLAPADTGLLVDHDASDHDAIRATLVPTH